jgi:hypothetical protein
VAIVHLPDEMKDAEETVALVEKEGRKCLKFAGDVGKPEVGICYDEPQSRGQLQHASVAAMRLEQHAVHFVASAQTSTCLASDGIGCTSAQLR